MKPTGRTHVDLVKTNYLCTQEPHPYLWLLPLDLVCLATYVTRHCRDVSVRIWDAAIVTEAGIREQLTAPPDACRHVVAFSPTFADYENALQLSRLFKSKGALIVWGGANSTFLAAPILRESHDAIDAIVLGDGELPLAAILNGTPLDSIPNTATWSAGRFLVNGKDHRDESTRATAETPDLATYGTADYSLVDLRPYLRNYTVQNKPYVVRMFGEETTFSNSALRVSQRGCKNRKGRARNTDIGCLFCGRLEDGWRPRPPEDVLHEELHLAELGVESVGDFADDLLADEAWFGAFWEAKRRGPRPGLPIRFCMARQDRITSETARKLAQIGTYLVMVGVESPASQCVASCNKRLEPCVSQDTMVDILVDAGIHVGLSYTFGFPSESKATLAAAYEAIEGLLRRHGPSRFEIYYSNFIPQPGSPSFARLRQAQQAAEFPLRQDYLQGHTFSVHEGISDWRDWCRERNAEYPGDDDFAELAAMLQEFDAAIYRDDFADLEEFERVRCSERGC